MNTSDDQKQGRKPSFLRGLGTTENQKVDKPNTKEFQHFPYLQKDAFLSPEELIFYKELQAVVPLENTILIKIRLADIFTIDRNRVPYTKDFQIYYGKIAQKHVDFLLCHAGTLNPLLGIELEDTSQENPQHNIVNEFVDNVFEAANFPLVRIPIQEKYNRQELIRLMSQFWESHLPPNCPKCDKPMVIRSIKGGENKGKQFYVCTDYKNCRTYFPIAS